MEQIEYLRILRRRWRVIAAAVLLGVLAALIASPAQPTAPTRTYQATHTLFRDPSVAAGGMSLGTMALLATTGEIPQRVAEDIGYDREPAVLASQVSAVADPELGVLRIGATGTDPDYTAEVANTFAAETLRYVEERAAETQAQLRERVDAQLEQQEAEIETLDREIGRSSGVESAVLTSRRDALIRTYGFTVEQLQSINQQSATGPGVVTLEAAVPIPVAEGGLQAPQSRGPRLALAALIAAILGAILAIVLDRLDVRIRTRRDVQTAFGLPVIAEIPKVRHFRRHHDILLLKRPGSYAAESFRMLRLSLQMSWPGLLPDAELREAEARGRVPSKLDGHVVLVTSSGPGEGKTTTVANVAASFAEVGKRVLILDCDFRHPQQHRYFACEPDPGMTDYLNRDDDSSRLADLMQQSDIAPGVSVVPNGTVADNPGELIGPDSAFLQEARQLADVVVVDAGPLLSVNDPIALMPHVDSVVLVARVGRITGEMANRTAEILKRSNAPVVGVSLMAVSGGASPQPYYPQGRSAPVEGSRRRGASRNQRSTSERGGKAR